MIRAFLLAVLAFAALGLGAPAAAQNREVPYWATLKVDQANMRVGPGSEYRISWVYRRVGLPLKVVRRTSGWRLVEDPDGTRGWMVARFLKTDRSAVVVGEGLADIRSQPTDDSQLLWRAEPGVVGLLGDCRDGWCVLTMGERTGWVGEARLWGAGEP